MKSDSCLILRQVMGNVWLFELGEYYPESTKVKIPKDRGKRDSESALNPVSRLNELQCQ